MYMKEDIKHRAQNKQDTTKEEDKYVSMLLTGNQNVLSGKKTVSSQ